MSSLKLYELVDPGQALEVYNQIFSSREGDDISFTPRIQRCGILYPIAFVLGKNEAQALVKAARLIGDNAFYLSLTERPAGAIGDWRIPLGAINAYLEKRLYYAVLANTLYSVNGHWGIILLAESFGAVGGSSEFVETFYSELGITNDQIVQRFINDYGEKIARYTLPIYFGYEQAQKYLEMFYKTH
jgi:hypothetical protein